MSDTTTRSGLLWEVERILSELDELPQILLMENVPDVIGINFIKDFQRWESRLRELGYSNHTEILNSKDYGIPQNRERAFMVSILGSSLYNFPQKETLKIRLKHLLEKEVDEKFYLSDVAIERISKWKAQQNPFKDIDKEKLLSPTLTARGAGEEHSGMILVSEATTLDEHNGTINQNGMIGTIVATQFKQGHGHSIVETKEFANYLTWEDSKGRINTQDHRAYFEDRLSGTIQAIQRGIPNVLLNSGDNNLTKKETIIYDDYNSTIRKDQDTIGTLTTNIGNDAPRNGYKLIEKQNNLRIRKLTPKECYRLMGFGDEAYELAAPKQSHTSLYHQAGDSIVVNVLMGLFRGLL
jgi:DNA (cytosine-5)-methyltransferase 1